MNKIKTIAVVTGSRAEYGILKPLLFAIEHSPRLRLRLYVTGMHLLKKYGLTVNAIQKDRFATYATIPMYSEEDAKDEYTGKALARGLEGFTTVFSQAAPDVVLVLGDRLEPLAATLAAGILNIPIGHIHGGDKTGSGHIDESTRHSITRYSHIHFAPTKRAAERLRKMGEQPFRVHYVGTLSIDSIRAAPRVSKSTLCSDLGIDSSREIVVALFHSLPLEWKSMGEHSRAMCVAIRALKKQAVVIYPNNDRGSEDIIREIEKLRALPHVTIKKSLPHEQYINLLRHADVLIGNSSSGIIEAPTLKLPVVNIGLRNAGREHANNIIFVAPERASIKRAVQKALYDEKFKAQVKRCKNSYGSGGTARKIAAILQKTKINNKLMCKQITY